MVSVCVVSNREEELEHVFLFGLLSLQLERICCCTLHSQKFVNLVQRTGVYLVIQYDSINNKTNVGTRYK